MRNGRPTRRIAAYLGLAAVISLGALTACGSEGTEEPTETPTTTTTTTTEETTTTESPAPAPSLEPTENAPRIDPGPNPFSPSVIAPPAPTAIPGDN